MKFIDLIFALHSIAARVEFAREPDHPELFVPAGKISQSSANELRDRVAPGIDLAARVGMAARRLNEALHDSDHPRPKLFKHDPKKAFSSPAADETWSRMVSLLLQAMFWGVREERYCLEHFHRATTEGERFLRGPIHRHEADDWLTPEGNVLRMTLLGFDPDELFWFLDANRIRYMRSVTPQFLTKRYNMSEGLTPVTPEGIESPHETPSEDNGGSFKKHRPRIDRAPSK